MLFNNLEDHLLDTFDRSPGTADSRWQLLLYWLGAQYKPGPKMNTQGIADSSHLPIEARGGLDTLRRIIPGRQLDYRTGPCSFDLDLWRISLDW